MLCRSPASAAPTSSTSSTCPTPSLGTASERTYADRTTFGELTLLFRHILTPLDGGGTRVTHQLDISGPGVSDVSPELGPQISRDFPVTVDELLAAARARTGSPLGS